MSALSTVVCKLAEQVPRYLPVISRSCEAKGRKVLAAIFGEAKVEVIESVETNFWDNRAYAGHGVRLIVPQHVFEQLDLDGLGELEGEARDLLSKVARADGEYIASVTVELADEAPLGTPLTGGARTQHADIWAGHPDFFRLFISHKWEDRAFATQVQSASARFGMSCFVAHKDIRPTTKWESEILRALGSMDALLALITPGFADSDWTDQEVGFALGRGVPIIPVRLGKDPYGFIGGYQGLAGAERSPRELTESVVDALLADNPPALPSLRRALVARFETSESYVHANELVRIIERMTFLPADLIDRLETAPERNGNVANGWTVINRLPSLVARLRGVPTSV